MTARRPRPPAERVLVARARRRVSAVVALVGTALIGVVGGLAYAVLVHGQQVQIDRELAYAVLTSDLSRPPGCVWLFVRVPGAPVPGSAVAAAATAPAGFPLAPVLDDVARTGADRRSVVTRGGTEYHVLTRRQGGRVVQAVFDARYQLEDRQLLLTVLLAAGAIGSPACVLAGMLVGRRAVGPLAEALARQRRFVADASHELRTPIANVHLRAQLMARRAEAEQLPPRHRDDLDRLVRTTHLLGEVVDDLLRSAALTRPGPPAGEPVDLAGLAEAAVVAESERAQAQGVVLTLHRPDAPLLVPGVASALRRVLCELITNALRHTPDGGRVEVRVAAAAPAPSGWAPSGWAPSGWAPSGWAPSGWARGAATAVELTVSDSGVGFDPLDAGRLFERHHHGTGAGERRFGLGLALVREVVAAHGGTVEAFGVPGRGALFTVRLPAPGEDVATRHPEPVAVPS